MSQNTDHFSSKPSSQTQPLNSALQAALGSLDVQIEEELTRYRRHRRTENLQPSYLGLGSRGVGESLDLIYITQSGSKTKPDAASIELPRAPKPKEDDASLPSVTNSSPSFLLAEAPKPDIGETANDDSEADSATLLAARAESASSESLASADKTANPDDYLESSEQLLKSLEEEEPPKQAERPSTDNLLSPLGIGSMLLFLMASATFGYVATNPSGLTHLGLNRFFNRQPVTVNPNPTNTPVATNSTPPASLPTSPNLASQEFVDLSLGNLSTLNDNNSSTVPKPEAATQPIPVAIPTMSVAQPPMAAANSPANSKGLGNLSSALLPKSNTPANVGSSAVKLPPPPVLPNSAAPNSTGASAPVAASPSPKPSPATAPSPSPQSNDDYYYVVADYQGEASLEKARQVVAEAYAREFAIGTRIQLGAFGDAATAQVLVQELQRQGLASQVYRP